MKEVLLERFVPEQSSLVEYLIYDTQAKELEVKYKRGKYAGKSRKYKGFIREEFDYITSGESVGKRLIGVLRRKKEENRNQSFWGKIQKLFTNY